MYKLTFIFLLILVGCSANKKSFMDELQIRYEKGEQLYNSGKYTRAKDELQYVVMNNPGSQMALDAQYLLGESHFQLKEYEDATFEYDRFARFSQSYEETEKARFRICECAINMSNSFQKDQSNTHVAIDRLQEFIEDYPSSTKVEVATAEILGLRYKLAKKEFESARLYLKLEEYDSALIYLNNVLTQYYDTEIVDEVRLTIVFLYLLENKVEVATTYLENQEAKFVSIDKFEAAQNLISNMKNGLGFSEYIRLYK
jgi:outer membrane protein assembly factor BamD